MAAEPTIGAAALDFMAASGGGVIVGIALSATAVGPLAAAFTDGAGLEALFAEYIC